MGLEGGFVGQAGESGWKHPDAYVLDDPVFVNSFVNDGVFTNAFVLPGSIDGPPG